MIEEIKKWKNDGEYVSFGPFEHKVFAKQLGKKRALAHKTLLLVHGFPESSYSFHKVINGLLEFFERIIVFDMLGYGLSDKPIKNYSYSLFEQADVALTILKYFEVKGGHLLAHDMGDSVATELVARHENQLLPEWFSDGFQSLTFTNGSMVLGLAKLRMTQKVLLSNYGSILKNMTTFKIFKQQVISAHGNNKLSEEDVKSLWDFNELQDGIRKTYLTIKYLNDRKRFEKTRWLPALAQTKLPTHICWGDADAVAKIEMAHYLKNKVCKNAQLTIMKDIGHFCQLGSPTIWLEHILAYYQT